MEDANFLGILAYRVYYIYAHRHMQCKHTKTGKEKKRKEKKYLLVPAPHSVRTSDPDKSNKFAVTKCHSVYMCIYGYGYKKV